MNDLGTFQNLTVSFPNVPQCWSYQHAQLGLTFQTWFFHACHWSISSSPTMFSFEIKIMNKYKDLQPSQKTFTLDSKDHVWGSFTWAAESHLYIKFPAIGKNCSSATPTFYIWLSLKLLHSRNLIPSQLQRCETHTEHDFGGRSYILELVEA